MGGAVKVDNAGNVYFTGTTFSSDFPTTSSAYDSSYNGGYDVFIAKMSFPFPENCTLTIDSSPGGITNPVPGSYEYEDMSTIMVEASPYENHRFTEWSGDVLPGEESHNPLTFILDSHINLTANFIRQYNLAISSSEGGTTNPSPGNHACDKDASISITAIPDSNFKFSHWEGINDSKREKFNPLTLIMDSDKSLKAHFIEFYPPMNLSGQKVLNRSLSQKEYMDALSWQAHPKNRNIVKYWIYSVSPGEKLSYIGEVGADVFKYYHRNLKQSDSFTYAVVAINAQGIYGPPAFITVENLPL
jgi:hypothetical protein